MSDFELSSTSGTPKVSFEADTGDCRFSGYSIPQKVHEFYEPILNWLADYGSKPAKETKLVMAMEYMDNASRNVFDKVFQILKEIQKRGASKVSVIWFFKEGDEDMFSLGKKYEEAMDIPFEYDKL